MVSGIVEKGVTILVAAIAIAVIIISIITMVRSSKLIKKYKTFSVIAQALLGDDQGGNAQGSQSPQ